MSVRVKTFTNCRGRQRNVIIIIIIIIIIIMMMMMMMMIMIMMMMMMMINIYIAQIPCEYDQMCVTNKYDTNQTQQVKNSNWWEADQLAIYKAWRS